MKVKPILSLSPEGRKKVAAKIELNSEPSEGGCIVWTLSADKDGYGRLNLPRSEFGKVRETGAHRAAWLALKGDIPEGLQIDHLCYNTLCVNVKHMELVTIQVNLERRLRAGRRRITPLSTGCATHGLSDGSVKVDRRGYSRYVCRACRRDYMREYMRTYKRATAT